ncbi:MAG: hypothetical protein CSA47_02245 [Gammaproteobacteria bacterium]|nr:MAG: hypothetical protein CSA47_02245 [Gammaproteobacteria bacterium]
MNRQDFRVADKALCWSLKGSELPFKTTKDVKPSMQIFGHDVAKEALTFSIECHSPGFNAYVRGLSGSGRKTLIRQVFSQIKPKARRQRDYCYVHNFSHPNVPRLIVLAPGCGKILKHMLSSFADFVVNDLPKTLNNNEVREKRKQAEQNINKSIDALYKPFEQKLKKHQLVLVNVKEGDNVQMVIAPLHDGKPVTSEAFNTLVEKGEIPRKQVDKINHLLPELREELRLISQQSNELLQESVAKIHRINNTFARDKLSYHLQTISKRFGHTGLDEYLGEIVEDFINNHFYQHVEGFDPTTLYGVNILNQPFEDDRAPVVIENSPTLSNLLGAVESEGKLPPYQSISAGSLLRADGGFLVIEVDEALSQGGAWATVMRTLRCGQLSIAFEDKPDGRPAVIKPEPLPLDIKVILIGSHQRFYELSAYDPDFEDQFKVLVDLDTELERQKESYLQYGYILRKVVDDEKLLHFNQSGVARLIEHGARLVGGRNKLSARFGLVMDIAREASYLAKKAGKKIVNDQYIARAIGARKQRSFAPANRFYQLLESGTIIIETQGERIGQINGLAVTYTGRIEYGFPARITATVSPGVTGLINIEGQANLSGQIHTKGFQILGGVLRHLLKPEHPLSFSASIAFEQSYGGIDGDSASGAEACCLLSAIVGTPIKQSLAMTGAIDQFGHIQAVGGVNEKIEGFFDTCCFNALTGDQGVIIPKANVDNLMLREDVVKACKANRFSIYAVDHVLDALAILTATQSCKPSLLHGQPYLDNSLLSRAITRVGQLYEQSKPAQSA